MARVLTCIATLVAALTGVAAGERVKLVSFDGDTGSNLSFYEWEDLVPGSQSWGNWSLNKSGEFGVFEASVERVPRPAVSITGASPGYANIGADGHFRNASLAAVGGAIVLNVRSSTPAYSGFRVAFASKDARFPTFACKAGGNLPFSSGCFKAEFSVPAGNEFAAVRVPLDHFTQRWSPPTGHAKVECKQDPTVCPGPSALDAIQRIEIWAEADGEVRLEIQSIYAESSTDDASNLVV